MQRSKSEFFGETRAQAEARLNEWKKANARAVAIVAQIIEMHPTGSAGCVIRIEYETANRLPNAHDEAARCSSTDQGGTEETRPKKPGPGPASRTLGIRGGTGLRPSVPH
jgi:hypothetical protein